VEFGHDASDVRRFDFIDATRPKQRENAAELDAMPDGGSIGDVDARGAPPICRLGERDCCRVLGELTEAGRPESRKLACHPPPACERFSSRREAAGVAMSAFAATEAVLDDVAAVAVARLPSLDPGARQGRTRSSR
jgi:hypothetical protein